MSTHRLHTARKCVKRIIPLEKHIWSSFATYEHVGTCTLLNLSSYMRKKPSGSHLGSAEEIKSGNMLPQALYGLQKRFKAHNSTL